MPKNYAFSCSASASNHFSFYLSKSKEIISFMIISFYFDNKSNRRIENTLRNGFAYEYREYIYCCNIE